MRDEPFDVEALLALPRLSGLAVAPDGSRLVTSVATQDRKHKRFTAALWEIDPTGATAPRRLTRSKPGESGAVFARDGSVLFLSSRPDPEDEDDNGDATRNALWRLPAGAGEASLIAAPPGGVDRVVAAHAADTVVFAASAHPRTDGWEADATHEQRRRDADVTAQLFTEYPIRYWDQYLGPRERHLHAVTPADDQPLTAAPDLMPHPRRALDEARFDVTPDGATVVTSVWRNGDDPRDRYRDLIAIDVATREQTVLATGDAWYEAPACSPDGRWVVCVRESRANPERAPQVTLWLVDLQTGEGRDLTPQLDLWPMNPVWAPDSSAVYFTADCQGRTPPYRAGLADGRVTRLSARGAFTDLCPSPDGSAVYALQSMVTSPPQPVALDPSAEDQEPRLLTDAWQGPRLSGRLERVSVTTDDGVEVWSWLLLPDSAGPDHPVPLAVLVHGGPLASWSGWHWRWSPHVLTARGYGVLLPDPALSTGYGQAFIQRGWGRWGDVVYRDVLSAVDAVTWRPEIDAGATAALGGSFGGYMVNWIAGHTDRFKAIVTHASLWDLHVFHGTTDVGVWWEQEFGDPYLDDERYRANSPHLHVGNISTPMLVIHGERDYRVPIDQALKLWTDLRRHDVESLFLYFPDEHHWILKPNNIRLWYSTVLGWLDQHVLGREWEPPDLL